MDTSIIEATSDRNLGHVAETVTRREHHQQPEAAAHACDLCASHIGHVALGEPCGMSASWDPDLVPAMQADGRRVFDEQVLRDLLDDLGS